MLAEQSISSFYRIQVWTLLGIQSQLYKISVRYGRKTKPNTKKDLPLHYQVVRMFTTMQPSWRCFSTALSPVSVHRLQYYINNTIFMKWYLQCQPKRPKKLKTHSDSSEKFQAASGRWTRAALPSATTTKASQAPRRNHIPVATRVVQFLKQSNTHNEGLFFADEDDSNEKRDPSINMNNLSSTTTEQTQDDE